MFNNVIERLTSRPERIDRYPPPPEDKKNDTIIFRSWLEIVPSLYRQKTWRPEIRIFDNNLSEGAKETLDHHDGGKK